MRIFLSHSSRAKPWVRQITDHFPPWIKTWVDEDQLLFGSELAPSLREAINAEADYVVLFFDRDAADSKWVKREVAWALEREEQLDRTFVLPVLLEDIRERLEEVGLAGRVTVNLPDFGPGSPRLLAERLVNHIGGWMSQRLASMPVRTSSRVGADELSTLGKDIVSLVDEIPAPWRNQVASLLMQPFVVDLAASRIGNIPLTPAQYYQRILAEMAHADSSYRILAVSTLSSDLWNRDSDQTRYAAENLDAASRGARIRRLFILPEARASSFAETIRRQGEAGINARVASTTLLAHTPDLQDFVLFENAEGARAYVSQPSIDGSRSIRYGMLVVSEHTLAKTRSTFEAAWDLASAPKTFFDAERSEAAGPEAPVAPGKRLRAYYLRTPVVTCEEAASARNVPLANELKTLLLQTHNGLVAAHLPGDGMLSLRKVKSRLESAEAYLADPEDLLDLGLSAGTVSAVLDPVWSMPHLVSRRLLTLDAVTTNNGTRTGYFKFDPAVLTEATDVIVDDFEKQTSLRS
jgi:prolyl-tRNA editing enzyme YbaK/EbsC (Cys-tRNA(Pro) deacylase)